MAGSLSESDVIEKVPRCPYHDKPCVVKTGTRNNSSHGKSFFICGSSGGKCSYAESSEFDATVCPHHLKMVELKAFASKPDGLRCYFRCVQGKEAGSEWCGNQLLRSSRLVRILKDITNCQPVNKSETKSKTHQISNKSASTFKNMHEKTSTDILTNNTHSVNNKTVIGKSEIFQDKDAQSKTIDGQQCTNKDFKAVESVNLEECCKPTDHSDIIEIVSSSDEEEEEKKKVENDSNTRGKLNDDSTLLYCSSTVEKPSLHPADTVESVEIQIMKQSELFRKISANASDGGKKLKNHIEHLQNKLKDMKSQQKASLAHQPPAQIKLPAMSRNPLMKPMPSYYLPVDKNAPLFGGRMTESRLKEVGRITKGAIEQLHKSLDTCPIPTDEAEDPKGLKVSLMTHQKQAMAWLMWREKQIPSGGILADDMGLGKTLTMISLSLKSKQDGLTQIKELPADSNLLFSNSTVIVCPASLVHQWHKEIEKRVEKYQLQVCLYHGPNRERRIRKLAACDIVLTTYNIVSIEGKPYVIDEKDKPKAGLSNWLDSTAPKQCEEGPLFKIFWRRIILDEGHNIKNPKTATSIAICHLEAESRWIVTGTPIQNQTMDLYSLIKFLRVSPFDELKVWKREVDNKSSAGTKRMNSIVKSLLLRRTKDQIDQKTGKPLVSLPKRSAILHTLKLSEKEAAVYDVIHKFSKNMFTQFLDTRKMNADGTTSQRGDKEPTKGDSSTEMPTHVLGLNIEEALTTFGLRGVNATNSGCLLVLLLRLRQCCAHLSLMCEPIDEELCKTEGIDLPLEEHFGNLSIDERNPIFKPSRPIELKSSFQSTKINTLLSQLKKLRENCRDSKPIKSVIVSQWTRMLDTIAYHLRVEGFKFDFITGSVNAKKRAEIVEDFNDKRDPQVMLVSLKAGGVGLNLIGGSHLFLLDQHWNPALEDQAADRIYRVGQQNDVVIHRFLCENTVEERIVQLQEKKKILANNVLYGGKAQKLTLDDLKMLFGLMR